MLGAAFALLAAFSFAYTNASVRRGVLIGSVLQALVISMMIGLVMFLAAAVLSGQLAVAFALPAASVGWLAISGVVHFIGGRYCNYRATKAMGSNLVAPVQQISLILSLFLAVVWLGEQLTPLRIFGIALILIAPAVSLRGASVPAAGGAPVGGAPVSEAAARPAFAPDYREGYLFAALSGVGYGLTPVMVRQALGDFGIGASIAGGLIAYAAAAAVLLPFMLLPRQARHLAMTDRRAAKWFMMSGVGISVSQMCSYTALALAPVTVVSPIQRLAMVFRLVFSWLMNRETEVFGPGILLGTALSLLGVLALSISTEFVLANVPLPDAVAAIAGWRWP